MHNLLTVRDVAKMLGIGEAALRKLVRQGAIPCLRFGPRTLRFDPEALDAWRTRFFDIEGGQVGNGTQTLPRLGDLALPVQDQRKEMESIDGGDRQTESAGEDYPAQGIGGVAQKAAHEVAQILAGHCRGSSTD